MEQTREKLHCVVCGWDWWKRLGAPDPKRCARATCRSMRWKGVANNTGATPEDLDAVSEGCSTAEGAADPELTSASPVLEAMRPAAERVVKRIVDELMAEHTERRYVPVEEES